MIRNIKWQRNIEKLKDTKRVNQKGQIMIYITAHINLKFEKHEPNKKQGKHMCSGRF
jgi:hypothetical protein